MSPADEDALVKSCYVPCDKAQVGREIYDWKTLDEPAIRLAIRAAVAHERERALQCAYSEFSVEGIAQRIAEAIRRGE